MKTMRRAIIFWFLAVSLGLFLCACGDTAPQDTETSSDSTPSMLTFDLNRYALVCPEQGSTVVDRAVAALQDGLSERGIVSDAETSECELLLGNTDRAESAAALAAIPDGQDYLIQFHERKIVIVAKHELALEEAIDMLLQQVDSHSASGVLTLPEGYAQGGEAKHLAVLSEGGVAQFELVFGSVSEEVRTYAQELTATIAEFGGNASVSVGAYDDAKNQIVIGKISAGETSTILGRIRANQYVVQKVGNKLIVAGKSDQTTMLAIEELIALLQDTSKQIGKTDTLAITLPTPILGEYCVPLAEIPEFADGTYQATYPCGNGNEQRYYTDVTPKRLDSYVDKLVLVGYSLKEDRTVGNNRFITCVGKNGLVHLTYLAYNKTLTVLLDPLTETVYKEDEPAYEKITDTTLGVLSLDYSHYDVLNGNGMSYVVTLEDGRYIIFDGGYKSSKDANILYNYLVDNNKRKDGTIVIAAWIFSHAHADHYGTFETFTSLYASRVKVEYFIGNTGDVTMYSEANRHGDFLDTLLPKMIGESYADAKVIKPHTGQVLTFCNVDFEVIYTHENYAPSKITSENNATLVLRMVADGVTTLFTGDCEDAASNLMSKMYGSALASDILQVNHHGAGGGTVEFYDYVNPIYTVWTTSQDAFEKRIAGVKYEYVSSSGVTSNKHLYQKVGRANCLIADGTVEQITFSQDGSTIGIAYYTPDTSYRNS